MLTNDLNADCKILTKKEICATNIHDYQLRHKSYLRDVNEL